MKQLVWATALIVAASISAAANAATPVGAVSWVRGECVGLSEGMTRALDAGAAVHLAEEISTGKAARLEIKFDDGTILTLGEHARLVIDSFVYNPADGLDELIVSATRSFRFVSGALKSEASTIRVETPLSLIGVRGTDFWGGPINDRYGVFLLEGVVTVANKAGEVLLAEPGEGVNLDGLDVPPGPVTIWPNEKAARALATVTFN